MLRVLRHYLPIRKALLIASETVLLTLSLWAWTSAHLWSPSAGVLGAMASMVPENYTAAAALSKCFWSSLILAVVAQVAVAFNELYDVRISGSRYNRASRFVESAGSALMLVLFATWLAHIWRLSSILEFPPLTLGQKVQALIFALLSGFLLLYLWRGFFHWLLRRANFAERVLVLGSGRVAHQLAREMIERPDAGFEVVALVQEGEVDDLTRTRPGGGQRGIPALSAETDLDTVAQRQDGTTIDTRSLVVAPLAGTAVLEPATAVPGNGNGHGQHAPRLQQIAEAKSIDLIAVAIQDRRKNLPTEELLECRLAGIAVREQEALYEQITGRIAIESLRPSYLIFNEGFSRQPWNELGKRLLDVSVSLLVLLLTWPLMLFTAIAVRLDSAGPILFSQERVGRDNRNFTLYKFRSMRADAEKLSGPVWATADDPRITRVGRFIRRTRLDELPQLFNVLSGDMSMVGPRPERPHFVADLAARIPYFGQRHIVKPGLTGWAQINYRYGSTFEDAVQKLQYDLFYIKNQSLLFDVSILFNTVKTVILRKGT
ncbi:MAG: TIGR03013 family PEP-CTERM/XrtA system glycosyltransferase [Planctomycetes bacterium]|nr:TIGR03013 family PEP-CTERM/XrtA system glycosyltransferase [Planctomycetota bacterium]